MILDNLVQDLRYAVRGLRAKPGFTIAIVATLALGIGANTAMFGIVDRLLFRPPPLIKDPETAHRVYGYMTFRGVERSSWGGQYARYADFKRLTSSFSSMAGYAFRDLAVGVGDAAREMRVGAVSASFFGFFDAPPVLGRYFTEDEDTPPSGAPVAVLGYGMWRAQFGERADVLGGKLQIGPTIYTIIGVAPPGFVGLSEDRQPVAYIPITSYASGGGFSIPGKSWWTTYSWGWMAAMARRKPGVSIEQADADLTQAMVKSYESQLVEQPQSSPLGLTRPRGVVGSIVAARGPNAPASAKVATWVGGVSVLVLLIACANVANLLLARALRRRREVAVRLALGVTRWRLLSQLLTESVLLAVVGGAAGLLVAHWGGAVLRNTLFERSEAALGFRDPRSILFALGAAAMAGLVTGLAPVLQARRADLTGDLKSGNREGTYHRSKLRVGLLVFQGALSVILLVGAGLFVRSLRNVESVRLGYDVDPVMLVELNMRGVELDTAQRTELRERLLRTAKAIPGVANASRQLTVPFWSTWNTNLYVEGIDTVSRLGQFNLNGVSHEFFETFGTRVVRGRPLTEQDTRNSPRVMVVSEAMARVLWPGREALGQCVRVAADTMPCTHVVGIAENIKARSLGPDSGFFYYMPMEQFRLGMGGLFVRAGSGDADDVKETVRRILQREMPGASYVTVTPFGEIIGGQKRSWRLGATMFTVFGALALVLAAIGLYSVIAYNVAQRTHELGVRVALGARAADVVRLIVNDGIRVVIAGIVIGGAVAFWASRWLEPLLFEVSPRDPSIFVAVAMVLLAVAVAASWIPALRASRVDPNVALRTE